MELPFMESFKYYFRRINVNRGTFVLFYSCLDCNDRGLEFYSNKQNTEYVIDKFVGMLNKCGAIAQGDGLQPSTVLSLDQIFAGDKINWVDIDYYKSTILKILEENGISESPVSLSGIPTPVKSFSIPFPLKKADYYRYLGQTMPDFIDGDETIYVQPRKIDYSEARKSFESALREILKNSEKIEVLPDIDLVNNPTRYEMRCGEIDYASHILTEKEIMAILTGSEGEDSLTEENQINGATQSEQFSGSSDRSQSEQEQNISIEERIAELQEKIETLGIQRDYEAAAYCKRDLALLLDSVSLDESVKIDYSPLTLSLQTELEVAAETSDYQKLAEIRQALAIIKLAEEQESASLDKRIGFFEAKIREAEESGNNVSKETWGNILKLANDAKIKKL